MHLSFITRGHIRHVNKFINELSTRYLPFQAEGGEKKIFEMRVCPIQLWDIIFPEEYRDAVCTTVLGTSGKPEMKSHQKYVWALRKAMKFKKIPKWNKEYRLQMDTPNHIETIGIGLKEDYWITEDGKHVRKKDKTPLSYEGL